MKRLLIRFLLLASSASYANGYSNTEYCKDMKALNIQEFRELSSADNRDDQDSAERLEVVMKIQTTLSEVCSNLPSSNFETSNYCEDVKEVTREEFRIASSAENIDDINAARMTNTIIDLESLLSQICN